MDRGNTTIELTHKITPRIICVHRCVNKRKCYTIIRSNIERITKSLCVSAADCVVIIIHGERLWKSVFIQRSSLSIIVEDLEAR